MTQLRLVRNANDRDETFQTILGEANRMGFEFCSFGMKSPVPLAAPRVAWCSNYPPEWQRCYEEKNYLQRDPTVRHAITSDQPVLWTDAVFADCPELRRDAAAHGLNFGWALPRRDSFGNVSLLSFVRSGPEITHEELEVKKERLQWLSFMCHEGMLKVWARSLEGERSDPLTERELDVLRWFCDGKTSGDVAAILSISEATVNFHAKNACAKLGTSNKTAAAVRAALMGMLW